MLVDPIRLKIRQISIFKDTTPVSINFNSIVKSEDQVTSKVHRVEAIIFNLELAGNQVD